MTDPAANPAGRVPKERMAEGRIVVTLDELLYQRRMTLTELAEKVDITLANLSILKTGKARAIRSSPKTPCGCVRWLG